MSRWFLAVCVSAALLVSACDGTATASDDAGQGGGAGGGDTGGGAGGGAGAGAGGGGGGESDGGSGGGGGGGAGGGTGGGGGGAANTAPVFGALSPVSVSENVTTTVTLTATDAEGDLLDFSIQAPPAFVTLAGATLTIAPTFSDSGSYTLNVAVSDGVLITVGTLALTVTNVNRPPVLTAIADRAMTAGTTDTLTVSATDPDGDTLTYSLGAGTPSFVSISGAVVTLAPTTAGSSSISVNASDGVLSDTKSFQLTVNPGSTVSGSISVNAGAQYSTSATVTLALSATSTQGTVDQMRFSNDGTTWTAYEAYATTKTGWTVGSASVDGQKTVHVEFRDGSGATARFTDSITLDQTAPTLTTFRVNGTAAAVNTTSVTLSQTVSDATSGVQMIEASNDAVTYVAVTSPFAWTLTSGDEVKTVSLRVTDNAGNVSTAQDTIRLDTTAPTLTGMTINSGATVTNSVNVMVSATAGDTNGSGVTAIAFANDAAAFGAYAAYSPTVPSPRALANVEGLRTVRAKVRDAAGNESNELSASITLDTTPPSGALTVNSGDPAATNTTAVTLVVTSSDAATYCPQLSATAPSATSACFVPLTSTAFTLSTPDGTKTVYAWLKDAAGNVSSTPLTDTILLDRVRPTASIAASSLGLAAGRSYVNFTDVTFNHTANDAAPTSGIAQVCVGDTSPPTNCVAWTNAPTLSLPTAEAPHTRYLMVVDGAGNQSLVATDTITYDVTAPVVTAVSINGGAATTSSTTVNVGTTVTDTSPLSTVELSNDGSTFTSFTYANPRSWTVPASDGTKTVTARVTDAAGNVSAAPYLSDDILLDGVAPSATLDVQGGQRYANTATVPLTITSSESTTGMQMYIEVRTATATAPTTPGTFIPFASPTNVNITAGGQGDKRIYVFLRDAGGNVTPAPPPSYLIAYDSLPPSFTNTFALNAGAAGTNVSQVTLNYAATDPSGITAAQAANDGVNFTGITGPADSFILDTASGEGAKTVTLRLTDGAGNMAVVTDSIFYDVTPPVLDVTSAGLGINQGAPYTNNIAAAFYSAATDNLSGVPTVCLGYAPTSMSCGFYGPAGFQLQTPDGVKTHYIKVIDGAGNESATLSDTITLDTVRPVVNSVLINDGGTVTTTFAVGVAVDATDNHGVAGVQFSNGGVYTSTRTYLGPGVNHAYSVPNPEGTKSVYAKVFDVAGNSSADPQLSDTIILDTPPAVYFVSPPFANSSPATAYVSSNQQCNEIAWVVQDASLPAPATPTVFTAMSIGTASVALPIDVSSGGEGNKRIYVWLKDTNGNLGGPATDDTYYDVTPPTAPVSSAAIASHRRLSVPYTTSTDTGSGVARYEVGVSRVAGGPYTFRSVLLSQPAVANLLANEYTHYVVVRAVDNAGNVGASSAEQSGTPYWIFDSLQRQPTSTPSFGLGYFATTGQYYYGGQYGSLYASNDLATWTRRDPLSDYEVRGFYAASDGFYVFGGAGPQGGSGFVSRTTDGAYFEPTGLAPSGPVYAMTEAGTTGSPVSRHYVLVAGQIFHGVRGATETAPVWSGVTGTSSMLTVASCANGPTACAGNGVVVAAGARAAVARSTDHGVTWTNVFLPSGYQAPFPAREWTCNGLVQMPGTDTLYLGCEYFGTSAQRGLLTSTNGGASWTEVTAFPSQDVFDLAVVGSDLWIAAETGSGGSGKLYKLAGGTGTTFVDITPLNLGATPVNIEPKSATEVAIITLDFDGNGRRQSGLWRTTNAGTSFSDALGGMDGAYMGMTTPDGVTFVGATLSDGIWRSSDSAKTFTQVLTPPTPATYYLNGIDLVDASLTGVGFAVGTGGHIFKTVDGGRTWAQDAQSRTITASSLQLVKCRSATACVAAGDNARLIVWNGTSWSLVTVTGMSTSDQFTALETYVDSSNNARVVAFSLNRFLARFDGSTWTFGTSSLSTSVLPSSLRAKRDGSGVILLGNSNGSGYRSSDHGASWSAVGGAQYMDHVSGTTTWYGVTGGTTSKSTDDGLTWAYQRNYPGSIYSATHTTLPMFSVMAPTATDLYVAGWFGTVLHSSTGGE